MMEMLMDGQTLKISNSIMPSPLSVVGHKDSIELRNIKSVFLKNV